MHIGRLLSSAQHIYRALIWFAKLRDLHKKADVHAANMARASQTKVSNSGAGKFPDFVAAFCCILAANRAVQSQLRSGLSTQQTLFDRWEGQERGKVRVIGNDENIGQRGKIVVQRSRVKKRELSADILQAEHRADEVNDGLR